MKKGIAGQLWVLQVKGVYLNSSWEMKQVALTASAHGTVKLQSSKSSCSSSSKYSQSCGEVDAGRGM